MPPTAEGSGPPLYQYPGPRHSSPDQRTPSIPSSHSLLPNDESRSRTMSAVQAVREEFFHVEPCRYTHDVYRKAARVYTTLKKEREDLMNKKKKGPDEPPEQPPPPLSDAEFKDVNDKRLTYELAFTTLKYMKLLEEICEESSLLGLNPDLVEHHGLVMVMLYDYQGRKFQQRRPVNGELLDPLCKDIEAALYSSRTKLNACFARRRVKASAHSIDDLLPETVRKTIAQKSKMPIYFWVNQLKTSISAVTDHFQQEGYHQVYGCPPEQLSVRQFRVDQHCGDVLVFSSDCSDDIFESRLLLTGDIVRQDKSSCLAPLSVKSLVSEDDDVIHVNAGSGLTTGHLASLLHKTKSHIYAFGAKNEAEIAKIRSNLDRLGAKNVKLIHHEAFEDVDPEDTRFKAVKVVLFTTECSKSALIDPVEFIVSEGEDMSILRDLSEEMNNSADRLGELMAGHATILRHAMKFSRVQAVVYMTRSVHEAENEGVVIKSIEYINMIQQKKAPFRLVPPMVPFSGEDIENSHGIEGKYIKFKPTVAMNGSFVAVITREPSALYISSQLINALSSPTSKSAATTLKPIKSTASGFISHQNSKILRETSSTPEDAQDAARAIIARAAKKGLMGSNSHEAEESLGSSEKLKKGSGYKMFKKGKLGASFRSAITSPVMAYIKSPVKRKPQSLPCSEASVSAVRTVTTWKEINKNENEASITSVITQKKSKRSGEVNEPRATWGLGPERRLSSCAPCQANTRPIRRRMIPQRR